MSEEWGYVCAKCHVSQGASVSVRAWVSVWVWCQFFVLFILFLCMWLSTRLSWRLFWSVQLLGGHFRVFDSQRHFSLTALLYSLYWPWDPLPSLESTPVSIYYPGQKNWDNRAHVAQARDLSSMHAPMFGFRACFNFFGQGSRFRNR